MKVKVGKWVRRNDGTIGKLHMLYSALCQGEECFEFHFTIDTIDNPRIRESIMHTNTIAVADTPQELIQEYDLVLLDGFGFRQEVLRIDGKYIELHGWENQWHVNNITKILTPNSNGDYIKQWEVE